MNPELTGSAGLDSTELALLGGLVVIMLVALGRALWTRYTRSRAEQIGPFRVFPPETVRRPMTPAPFPGLAWAPPATPGEDDDEGPYLPPLPTRPPVIEPAPIRQPPIKPAAVRQPAIEPAPMARHPAFRDPGPQAAPAVSRDPPLVAAARGRPAAMPAARREEVDEASETIRLPTAADGTVQILPGSLVVAQGPEVGREYRFLRLGSQAIPEVTLGRLSGPPYRHIQLPAATVSRMHARIRYLDGSWHIANLSDTNPVAVNGREVRSGEEPALADGDRIQLGEVELHYRDRRS